MSELNYSLKALVAVVMQTDKVSIDLLSVNPFNVIVLFCIWSDVQFHSLLILDLCYIVLCCC